MDEQNPYTPPSHSPVDFNDRDEDSKETRTVRIIAAFVALCCLQMPLGVDYRHLTFSLLAVLVMLVYAAFAFGCVAFTGRWFSFKRLRAFWIR